ncbi:DUF1700 domain-containing protein [Paenibacillus endoradicis]|uniref:DUF1700 domain-containing protein n=1 Tax=Paenibacillus endoradicis TaxID=2972487 RepID=UPI002158DAD3|nr:DUF1700 domain-containing protein [Paenibacillus endoradicis]MCR8658748.1 DUF1700 domain-containing protein [Paenibacillus endoradicis]
MNKDQFLTILRKELKSMPIKEQNELLEDYETHFAFGVQAGKTEEEISLELGNPLELAQEAREEYLRNPPSKIKKSESATRTVFAIIGLFFLNFVFAVVPLALSIWVTWLSLSLSAAIMVIAPVLVLFNFTITSQFIPGQLFAALAISGLGLLLCAACIYLGKMLLSITKSYYHWNVRVIKGGK